MAAELDRDLVALRDLSVRYAIAVDDGDGEAFAGLFGTGARLRMFRSGDGEKPSVDVSGGHRCSTGPGRPTRQVSTG